VDYRERIYENYATNFQDLSLSFDEANSRAWGKAYHHYFRGWLPTDKSASIVDIACGGGKLLHFFQELRYGDVRGVDLSPEQVRIARQVVPNVTEENVLDYLGNNLGAFDLITGLDIIEHLNKSEVMQLLDATFAALKPGGRLILQTPNSDSPWGMAIRYGDFTHEVCFNANVLTRLLALTGFRTWKRARWGLCRRDTAPRRRFDTVPGNSSGPA
jgi:2-polyprenyl-3-methyl-5-hydroxy-6-metoxy-1,4-benzoquinol methylase